MSRVFELKDLIRVAKRENNTKRSYLYVNPVQGKHIPVSPEQSLDLFEQMAKKLEDHYPEERLLVIGFAETATAIGSAIAFFASNADYYMSTTREDVPGSEYLFFTESHSHATEQRLAVVGLDKILNQVDRIVFAEDEVTTGNTIEKLVRAMEARYPEQAVRFGIISILNSMSEERIEELGQRGIACDYIQKIPAEYHVTEIEKRCYEELRKEVYQPSEAKFHEIIVDKGWNSRKVCRTDDLRQKCKEFCKKLENMAAGRTILVLGTEECMFPGMLLADHMKNSHSETYVRFHATTRSPIEVSLEEGYPLQKRYPLISLYEEGRRTFVYNLQQYEEVWIVTDADTISESGLASLIGALEESGNKNITLVKWREDVYAK